MREEIKIEEKDSEIGKKGNWFQARKIPLIFAMAGAMALGGGAVAATQNLFETERQEEFIAEKKEYTMLFYVIGSDLEADSEGDEQSGAASKDMEEIAAAMKTFGLDDSVHVVAQIGGSESWQAECLADVKNARLTIDGGGIHVTEKLADTDMGERETLTDFIDYACKTYPAEHYILVFWNHGSGPVGGYGYDVLHEGSSLKLDELQRALECAQYQEFELIGFDACCMGNMETANALRDYTEYMVASPAREDIEGWDYSWLEILGEKSLSDAEPGKEIGKKIVDAFAAFYQAPSHKNKPATLSCYDMGAYEMLREDIAEYSRGLLAKSIKDEDFCGKLSGKRNQIAGYDSGGAWYDVMDLLDFKQLFICLDEEQWERYEMQDSLKEFVCYTTGISMEMSGISIYLPGKQDGGLAEDIFFYLNCCFDENYLQFVYKYAQQLDGNLEMDLEKVRMKYEEKTKKIQFLVPQELKDQIATAYIATVFQAEGKDEYYLLSTDSDVTVDEKDVITGVLDIKYFAIADQPLCLIEKYNSETRTEFVSPILYQGKLCWMTIEVSEESERGKIVSIIPYDEEQGTSKEQYILEPGKSFCPLYPIIRQDGEGSPYIGLTADEYHKGELVELKEYDCKLGDMDINFNQCLYGLMIRDKAMGVHYSGFSPLK